MQPKPAALVPREALSVRLTVLPDTLVLGEPNLDKLNSYRSALNQPPVDRLALAPGGAWCMHYAMVGSERLGLNANVLMGTTTPNAAAAADLFTFMAQNYRINYFSMGCDIMLDVLNPVTLTLVDPATFVIKTATVQIVSAVQVMGNVETTVDPYMIAGGVPGGGGGGGVPTAAPNACPDMCTGNGVCAINVVPPVCHCKTGFLGPKYALASSHSFSFSFNMFCKQFFACAHHSQFLVFHCIACLLFAFLTPAPVAHTHAHCLQLRHHHHHGRYDGAASL